MIEKIEIVVVGLWLLWPLALEVWDYLKGGAK